MELNQEGGVTQREISNCRKTLPSGTGGTKGDVRLPTAHKLCLLRPLGPPPLPCLGSWETVPLLRL